jgi:hypothetical protein
MPSTRSAMLSSRDRHERLRRIATSLTQVLAGRREPRTRDQHLAATHVREQNRHPIKPLAAPLD